MWYTKSYNRYSKATVTVEADSIEEAQVILDDWLDEHDNNVIFADTLDESVDKCDYWLSMPQDTPFDKADIRIGKRKIIEPKKTDSRVDLAIYVLEDPKIRHAINGQRYYKNISPEEFLALIKDWSENFSLKVMKCYETKDCPTINIVAVPKAEFINKIDVNYVEVK